MQTILIEAGTIVTMGPLGVLAPGSIFTEGTRIIAIGPVEKLAQEFGDRAAVKIDARGKIVMPGLIDAHYHTCQQFHRGLRARMAEQEIPLRFPYWKCFLIPQEDILSNEDVYLSSKAAYANMVRVGTTCVSEHGGRHPEAMAGAMEGVGIRGLLAISTMDMDVTEPPLPKTMKFTTQEAIDRNLELVTKWPFQSDGLVRGCFSLRQILVCTPELIKTIVGLAEEHDTMVQTHLGEGDYETDFALEKYGLRPVPFMASLGALSPRIISAHSVLLTDEEVELFEKHKVGVAHCPSGNFSWLGMTKLPLMRRLGIKVGIGSDGAAGGSIDLFEQMRISRVGQTLYFGAPYRDRSVVEPLEILQMATIDGARVVGLENEIGSLEVGKRADLIVLEPDLNALPMSDPIDTIVKCLSARNVETVIINGQLVMKEGRILTVDEVALTQGVAERGKQIQEKFLATLK